MNKGTHQQDQNQPLQVREIHLKDLVAVVTNHWFLVLALSAIVGGGAWFSSRSTLTAYQSRLTVQINSPKQVFARLDDIDVDELALRTDPILSEALFLTTHELALRVTLALGLQLQIDDALMFRGDVMSRVSVDSAHAVPGQYFLIREGAPGYRLLDEAGNQLAGGAYTELAHAPGFSFNVRPTSAADTVSFQIVPYSWAATGVTGSLGYTVRPSTNAVDITFTGHDPTLVPIILNRAATELRDDGEHRALSVAQQRLRYTLEQTRAADSSYQEKLREIETFKKGELITDLGAEEQAIVNAIQQLEVERRLVLVQLSTISEGLTSADSLDITSLNRLAAVQEIGSNAALTFQIQNLLELYDDRQRLTAGALGLRANNPQISAIEQRIEQGHASLRGAVDATIRTLQSRLQAIEGKINEQRDVLSTYPGKETRIAQLTLEREIINDTYRYLLGQYEVARLQEATIAPYVDILDGASAPVAVGASVKQKVILGCIVGLFLGLAGAFFLDYLDQTVKTAADIERILRIPVLGLIPEEPHLSARNGQRLALIDRLDRDHPAAEAYRSLRTNVTFVGAERPVQYLSITSPGPQEGKSTTAANLAVTLAQSGRRTILIDGDLRRPQIHRAFSLVEDVGLTDLLVGRVARKEAIRPDVVSNLDIIPSGPRPPNPSELLGSDAMHTLITELRKEYEFVIIDTPPTLPVTDAAVVATSADATIMVIRSGETEEHAAERAFHQLQRVRSRIAGAVLNGVSPKKDRQYSYYSYGKTNPPRRGLQGLRSRLAAPFS